MNTGFKAVKFDVKSFKFFTKPNRKYFTVKVFFTNGYNNHKPKSKTILVVTS